jgi:hypothetical protein
MLRCLRRRPTIKAQPVREEQDGARSAPCRADPAADPIPAERTGYRPAYRMPSLLRRLRASGAELLRPCTEFGATGSRRPARRLVRQPATGRTQVRATVATRYAPSKPALSGLAGRCRHQRDVPAARRA